MAATPREPAITPLQARMAATMRSRSLRVSPGWWWASVYTGRMGCAGAGGALASCLRWEMAATGAGTSSSCRLRLVAARGARHGNDLVTAQTFNLARLQYAQQFGLQFQRNVANFVQHQGTAVGQFKASLALRAGTGKGPFFVPEKFAFHKPRRHCGALNTEWHILLSIGK